jgi:hypothetical protein
MTIKVIYNWIGPRGPTDNTELPTILGFAGVATGAATSSHKFWAEGLWTMLFRHDPEFTMHPVFTLQAQDVFLYPYHLGWRIKFENYFCQQNGILEFSHAPYEVIEGARHGNGFIVLDMSAEAYMDDYHLGALHSYFPYYRIPLNKVIYITGCMNTAEVYNDYCRRNNIPDTPETRLSIISYPSAYEHTIRLIQNNKITAPIHNTFTVPQKLFLCWNRRIHPHRIITTAFLEKYGVLDRSYVSLPAVDPEYSNKFTANIIDRRYYNESLGINDNVINSMLSKLPLILDDETDVIKMCGDFEGKTRQFYINSLISIVTETYFDNPAVTLTEKSFKPAKEKHPFILVGAKGALASMHRLGFQTFGDFWDESYDNDGEVGSRMRRIGLIIEKIAAWTPEEILNFKRTVVGRLEHNYKLVSTMTEFNPTTLVVNDIKSIVNKGIKK